MPKFSFYPLVYRGEPLADSFARLAAAGYDAIELPGSPESLDPEQIRRLCQRHSLHVSSLCGRHTPGRSLASPDGEERRTTVQYVKDEIDLAAAVKAPVVIVAPTAVRAAQPFAPRADEWRWATETLRELGDYAGERGVTLALEAWNRYETHLLNRLDQALALRADVGLDSVGVMGDIFHLNIEEVSLADAIRACGRWLAHFHFCDSNRAAPGTAHVDFPPILQALKDIEYQGYWAMEMLTANWPWDAETGREFYDVYPRQSIEYLSAIWSELS